MAAVRHEAECGRMSSPESWMKSGPIAARCCVTPPVGGGVLHAGDILELDSRSIVSTDMSMTERAGML